MMDAAVLYEIGRRADYVVGSEETTSIALTNPDQLPAKLVAQNITAGKYAPAFNQLKFAQAVTWSACALLGK